MVKIDTLFQTKTAKTPGPLAPHIPYNYKGVPSPPRPPPPGGGKKLLETKLQNP